MYKSRRCSRCAGFIGIPRKTEQTGNGEQPFDRLIGIHGTLGKGSTGSPGPAAHRALTLLLKFLKTYQNKKLNKRRARAAPGAWWLKKSVHLTQD